MVAHRRLLWRITDRDGDLGRMAAELERDVGLMTGLSDRTISLIHLAWHDVTCPEGPECRDRDLHAVSSSVVQTGIAERFALRLAELGEVELEYRRDQQRRGRMVMTPIPETQILRSPRPRGFADGID